MNRQPRFVLPVLFALTVFFGGALAAQAGVFSTPQFVEPGNYAIGMEPELDLTSGAGLGVNARYTQGLTDLNNLNLIVGTGGGPRHFRAGGNLTFDFFPDIEGQPGIGIAAQGLWVRTRDFGGQLELTGVPYIHKTFISKSGEVQPFFSFPFGMAFYEGNYKPISSAVVGSMFKSSEKMRYVLELGIAVNHTESYISGGIVYYH